LGFLSEEVNLEPIVPAFQDVFINAVEQGVSKMDFKSVTDDMSGVMYKFPFRLPPYYALIIRSLLTLEGIALSVDPNFKILGIFSRLAQRDDKNKYLKYIPYTWSLIKLRTKNGKVFDELRFILNNNKFI